MFFFLSCLDYVDETKMKQYDKLPVLKMIIFNDLSVMSVIACLKVK